MFFVKQTGAEEDQHLLECFYDKNYYEELFQFNYNFISGRKGAGKTALARFAAQNTGDGKHDFCKHLSISEDTKSSTDIPSDTAKDKNFVANGVLVFLLIRFVQNLLKDPHLDGKYKRYWECFLEDNNFTDITNFDRFYEVKKIFVQTVKLDTAIVDLGGGESTIERVERRINDCIDDLWEKFLFSLPFERKYNFYLDDIDTRLDLFRDPNNEALYRLLEKISKFNSLAVEQGKGARIIVCIRSDMWNFLHGSNKNKIRTNSLDIDWSEEDFMCLLAKRVNPKEKLEKSRQTVDEMFPDNLYEEVTKGSKLKSSESYFYSYIFLLSFNRPRDFLHYGYIASKKFPKKQQTLSVEHINSVEGEFCAYLRNELEDEFDLLCTQMGISVRLIDGLIRQLSIREGFDDRHFKTEKNKLHFKKQSDAYELMKKLWEYSVIGVRRTSTDKSKTIFQYFNPSFEFPLEGDLKTNYEMSIHPGLRIAYNQNMLNG